MIVGTTISRSRQVHRETLKLSEVREAVAEGLALADEEKGTFMQWLSRKVRLPNLAEWVDAPTREEGAPTDPADPPWLLSHVRQTSDSGRYIT